MMQERLKRRMKISIRKFERKDIPDKVRWINDPKNNKYLHYDLPLEIEKTEVWFERIKDRTDRYDAVIEADGIPVGLIGLLSIDKEIGNAEYYVSMGEHSYKGKGVAYNASMLILEYAFFKLRLDSVYLFTETENVPAQRLFEKLGFVRKKAVRHDAFANGKTVDRYYYILTRTEFLNSFGTTPIQYLGAFLNNRLYVKREDMIPYSFGGNKARKADLFFKEFDRGNYDCIVTYGSSHSNHCRIVANMAAQRGVPCYIISPEEASVQTYNSVFMELLGADITVVPVERVSDTIECRLHKLKDDGCFPYFIPGGGHGNVGTQAYVNCFDEISDYEEKNRIHFDYIFFATGTGTTQAGLVCGQLLRRDTEKSIVGISIARNAERGSSIVIESVTDYLCELGEELTEQEINDKVIFVDDYVGNGYADVDAEVIRTVKEVFLNYGIPLDSTYTGKAFDGMRKYITVNGIKDKRVLFIHTGGTPLFFDDVRRM